MECVISKISHFALGIQLHIRLKILLSSTHEPFLISSVSTGSCTEAASISSLFAPLNFHSNTHLALTVQLEMSAQINLSAVTMSDQQRVSFLAKSIYTKYCVILK